jgi:aminomuconate-semialdehyde/2-hydroxymuconate-6-semialdehyde dehydrogenase
MNALRRNCVDDEWVETGHALPNITPKNGSKICDVSGADQSTVACAVEGAYAAMRRKWGSRSAAARAKLPYKAADRISARFDESLKAETADTGHSHSHARTIDVPRGAANIRIFADLIKRCPTEAYELATPDGGKALNYAKNNILSSNGQFCAKRLSLWCRSHTLTETACGCIKTSVVHAAARTACRGLS